MKQVPRWFPKKDTPIWGARCKDIRSSIFQRPCLVGATGLWSRSERANWRCPLALGAVPLTGLPISEGSNHCMHIQVRLLSQIISTGYAGVGRLSSDNGHCRWSFSRHCRLFGHSALHVSLREGFIAFLLQYVCEHVPSSREAQKEVSRALRCCILAAICFYP